MKKIFTLMIVALMAINASAQETALFENGGTYNNGYTLSSANAKVVLGNDRTTKPYDLKLASCKAYLAPLFGQIVQVQNEDTGEMEDKTRVVYVVGNQNPKDGELDGDKSAGSGYKPESGNLPQSGTYYMFTPTKAGHVCVFVVLNSGKNFYVVKASDGTNLPVSDITIKADGEEPTVVAMNDDFTIDEKCTGTVEFDVVANETYYIFCTGSKLSFGGYVFTVTDEGGETSDGTIWEGDGSAGAVSWNGIYRFALEGHDGANECIAEIPQAIWDKMTTETFYLDLQSENPQIRVTNGWWEVQWKDDIMPGNPLLTNNGDGTWTLEVNLTDNPDFIATLLEKHLLFTGDRYTPVKLYFKDSDTPGPGPEPQPEDGWMELVKNGNVEGEDGTSLISRNGESGGGSIFNPVAGQGVDGSTAAMVHSVDNAVNGWDSQFFIYAPDHVFATGEQYKVSFWVRADKPASSSVQAHKTPGEYLHWCVITDGSPISITTEWKEFTYEGTVSAEQNGMQTIAFNLNDDLTLENNYYFDNISWKVAIADGIDDVKVVKTSKDASIYNLAGQKVDASYKGIIIKNGKKYINK